MEFYPGHLKLILLSINGLKGGKVMQPTSKPQTANWEITAISLRCDHIGDFVTVRVSGDWLAKCTWYLKYKSEVSKGKNQERATVIKQRMDKCVGPDCPIVTKYRGKLIEEASGKK